MFVVRDHYSIRLFSFFTWISGTLYTHKNPYHVFGIPTFLHFFCHNAIPNTYIKYIQNQVQMLENHDLSSPFKAEGFHFIVAAWFTYNKIGQSQEHSELQKCALR